MRPLLVLSASTALVAAMLASESRAGIVYVSRTATGANNGTSWSNAFTELRDALPTTAPGDQVWIAAGTYTPAPSGGSVLARFTMTGIEVYGGFRGTESSLAQRNWNLYPAVLSGDLNGDDGSGFGGSDNSRRIVDVFGGVLDGLTVQGGVGYQLVSSTLIGHAASVRDGQIRHCIFRNNRDGALDLWSGGQVSDSLFYRNGDSGIAVAAMHEQETFTVGAPTAPASISNCTFYDNRVLTSGNGVVGDTALYFGASPGGSLSNTIFYGNQGPAIMEFRMDTSQVSGCLIDPPLPPSWYYPHISGDPRFVSAATYDLRLLPDSPCIDAGTNAAVLNAATAMDGHPRRQEIAAVPNTGIGAVPIVDIGAYEVMADCNGNGAPDFEEIASGAAADANGNTILDTCEGGGSDLCLGDQTFGLPCPCGNQATVGGCSNSAGHGAVLSAFGQARVSDDSLALSCSGMGANAPALYFQGDAIDAIYGPGGVAFGDGLRCVFGTIIRLGIKASVNGSSMFGAGVGNDPRISVRGALPAPGGTRHYQVWYRDGATFCTPARFNTSNGLTIAWGA
ncbi:MAG: right-handed parallel beta-helix repeat-containing protein [Planctomycetes bacterium]|nr:right-handed parallel beta-helix repeat-containing protein [Planctomycetota bacterium]